MKATAERHPSDRKTELKKRNRYSRKPSKAKPELPGVDLTKRDIDTIFPLLAKYRYLNTKWIHAFMGGDYQSFKNTSLGCS